MANDLNQCQFIGRLGNDPESRFMPSGDQVVNFNIACGWKGKDKEGVEWVRVVAFGKLAEIMAQYLRKGSQVFISGSMRTRSWDKDGQKHYSTEIVADRMQMLGGRSEGQQGARQAAPKQQSGGGEMPPDDFIDDIPFVTSNSRW